MDIHASDLQRRHLPMIALEVGRMDRAVTPNAPPQDEGLNRMTIKVC